MICIEKYKRVNKRKKKELDEYAKGVRERTGDLWGYQNQKCMKSKQNPNAVS